MRRLFLAASLALCAACLLPPAGAEEGEGGATPEAAYAKRVAAFGEPTTEAGFDFMGVMLMDGKRIGHARLVAAPVKGEDGVVGWEAKDAVVVKMSAVPQAEVSTVRMDRHLALRSGSVRTSAPGGGRIRWEKTEKGYRAFRTTKEGVVEQEEVRNHEVATPALTTLASVVLFLRSALPEPGHYAVPVLRFKESFKGEPLAVAMTVEVVGEKSLEGGHRVLVGVGRRGDKTLTVLFDVETRRPVGLRIEEPARKIEIVAGDRWTLPATKALDAALRAAYSFGTGDLEVLDDVIHWQSIYKKALDARTEEQKQKEAITIDQYRETVMTQLQKNLPKNPPEMIGGVVAGIQDQVKLEKQEDGTVKALFPPVFKNLELLLGEEGGIWYLVQMPGAK